MTAFLTALRFLTILPVRGGLSRPSASLSYFPLAGLVIGLLLAGVNYACGLLLPAGVTSALTIAAMAVITGCLHLDGLADSCDGLGGNHTPEERRRIMKDSRTGAFGVVGVVMVLLLKYAALASMPQAKTAAALILMATLSRWAMAYAVVVFPAAFPAGLGGAFKEGSSRRQLVWATVCALAAAAVIGGPAGLAALVLVWLAVALLAACFRRMLGGLSGDSYGAVNEVAEVVVLIAAGALPGWFIWF